MITDQQSNFLYLSEWLPKCHPTFYGEFEKVLQQYNINFKQLSNTNDIWAVDFMPIQIEKDKFLQFVYRPDYLVNNKKKHKFITDASLACEAIGIKPIKYDIVLDGGNVIRTKDRVIMCEKVFKENKIIKKGDLIGQLKEAFQVDRITFIPQDPYDKIGHADGMIRFLTDDTVLINEYSSEDYILKERLLTILKYIEIPYNPYSNDKKDDAKGIYINYLQMEQTIILPIYGMEEDIVAIKQFEELFSTNNIATIDSKEIALGGGILNCLSWNILK